MLAHGAEDLAARQRRADGIAVGPGVRGQHEALVLSDLPEYILEHVARPFFHLVPCGPCFFFSPAPTILPRGPFPVPRGPAGSTTPARASNAGARPVRGGCIPARLPDPRDSDRHLRRRLLR